jgi:hypothetical protein
LETTAHWRLERNLLELDEALFAHDRLVGEALQDFTFNSRSQKPWSIGSTLISMYT